MTVKPMPGAIIARMKNVNYADADVVIVHAGTYNLKKQSDPEELADEIVSTLRHIKSNGISKATKQTTKEQNHPQCC